MKINQKIFFFLLLLILSSCLDENSLLNDNIELDGTAKILRYIESIGDFANTDLAPALISASELFSNNLQYSILDIREPQEFTAGHIEFARNISVLNLYEIVDSLNKITPLKNIVIISKNGQASAYFVCLLRLAGFTNVYTLNYGMASWNVDFAAEWLGALGNSDQSYLNLEYPKKPFTNLPNLEFPPSLITEQEKTNYRIKEIIKKGFISGVNFSENISTGIINTHFLVCYGKGQLYGAPRDLGSRGHPENTVWFKDTPLFEFRSTNSLQTLPNNQPILIYSGDGQLSSCMTAYLTFLGYDVKSLLFGANQLFYFRLNADPTLTEYIFSMADIMNYPYTTGN
ncbi:MAG: rhodanese-like domain-containing protein [Ignavibacteriales bacterium]|nr:rhodanese-like domain-containing protein [Ignavibacteriales bacterium]